MSRDCDMFNEYGSLDRFLSRQMISELEEACELWADPANRPAIREEFGIKTKHNLNKLLRDEYLELEYLG